jgi:acyl-CoA thioester hydrolase
MQGHVFSAHYLTWFDMAHTELLARVAGRPYVELVAGGVDVVVAEAGVRYLAPAHYDDALYVAAVPEALGNTSVSTRFTVVRDGETIATGFMRHVCVDAATLSKRPWPEELRAGFAHFLGRSAGDAR